MGLTVSVVAPVYRGAGTIEELHRRWAASTAASLEENELVLVDDASPDDSWEVIRRIVADDARVVGVRLAHNVRQTRAAFAGFEVAGGDVLMVMDSDLEHPPEVIPTLVAAHEAGNDLVLTRRRRPRRSAVRRAGTGLLKVAVRSAGISVPDIGSSLLLMDRKVEQAVRPLFERTRVQLLLPAMVEASDRWTVIDVELDASGPSTYPFRALVLISGQFLITFVLPRLLRPALGVTALGLAGAVTSSRPTVRRRALVLTAVAAATAFGAAASTIRLRRLRPAPLYEIAEVIGRRS